MVSALRPAGGRRSSLPGPPRVISCCAQDSNVARRRSPPAPSHRRIRPSTSGLEEPPHPEQRAEARHQLHVPPPIPPTNKKPGTRPRPPACRATPTPCHASHAAQSAKSRRSRRPKQESNWRSGGASNRRCRPRLPTPPAIKACAVTGRPPCQTVCSRASQAALGIRSRCPDDPFGNSCRTVPPETAAAQETRLAAQIPPAPCRRATASFPHPATPQAFAACLAYPRHRGLPDASHGTSVPSTAGD